MRQVETLFEAVIDGIIAFTDYFIIRRHITLSEGILFALLTVRAVWFTIFGIDMGSITTPGLLTHEAWTPLFWLLVIFHFIGFFQTNLLYRIIVVGLYAILWCFLGLLVAFSQYTSPALPTFMTFSLLSVFITVRLIRDWRT